MENINYAFLDENGLTLDVAVFESVLNSEEEAHYKNIFNADKIVRIEDPESIHGVGCIWDEASGRFKPPSPHPSWIWDEVEWSWICPVPFPEDIATSYYYWNETEIQWIKIGPIES